MSTNKLPTVSVIMPVFNASRYLKQAIDSILQQSYGDFELIIINDGSTDNSKQIIDSYTDERIVRLNNAENAGLVFSLNYGVSSANGRFIARMDGDDISQPERLKKQVDFLDQNPSYGLCGSFYRVIDSEGSKKQMVQLPVSDNDIKTFLQFGNCLCHSTVMFRRNLTKHCSYQQEFFLTEDYKLWYDFSKFCQLAVLPEYLLDYRVHDNNISATKKVQTIQVLMKLNRLILTDLDIRFTERELAIHTHFLMFNAQFFSELSAVRELESWLLTTYAKVSHISGFNKAIVANIFLRRWFVICFKGKHFTRILYSSLIPKFKWSYARTLSKKISDSYSGKNLGIDF